MSGPQPGGGGSGRARRESRSRFSGRWPPSRSRTRPTMSRASRARDLRPGERARVRQPPPGRASGALARRCRRRACHGSRGVPGPLGDEDLARDEHARLRAVPATRTWRTAPPPGRRRPPRRSGWPPPHEQQARSSPLTGRHPDDRLARAAGGRPAPGACRWVATRAAARCRANGGPAGTSTATARSPAEHAAGHADRHARPPLRPAREDHQPDRHPATGRTEAGRWMRDRRWSTWCDGAASPSVVPRGVSSTLPRMAPGWASHAGGIK